MLFFTGITDQIRSHKLSYDILRTQLVNTRLSFDLCQAELYPREIKF